MADPLYYIRSIKHDQNNPKGNEQATWWRPGGKGYTADLAQAGKYTLDQAKEIGDQNQDIRFEGKGRSERQLPEDLIVPVEVADGLARLSVNKYDLEAAMRRLAERLTA